MNSSLFTFTSFASVLTGSADIAWTNPGNAQRSDDAWATAALTNDLPGQSFTQYLHCTRQNSTPTIPNNCKIIGIQVMVERKGTQVSRNGINDKTIQLIDDSGTRKGDNKAAATVWPTSDGTATYGGVTDKWGITNLSPAFVNNFQFGVAVQAKLSGALFSGSFTASVDYVYMTIWWRSQFLPMLGVT